MATPHSFLGCVSVSGGNTITGDQTFSGAVACETTLAVTGAATLSSTCAITGAVTCSSTLAVTGAVTMSSTCAVTGALTVTAGITGNTSLTVAPSVLTSGVRTALTVTGAADTGRTASTEQPDLYINLGRTVTWATGALTNQRAVRIAAPTLAFVGASTVTNAATFYVDAAPAAGANATITNSYALWVDAGTSRFDGLVSALGGLTSARVLSASGTPLNDLLVTAPADTAITASTESPSVLLDLSASRQFATGALTSQRAIKIAAPTYAFVGASTITNAATLYVDAAPTAGTNATITNSYAVWVDAGMTRLDGGLTLAGDTGFYGAAAAAQPAAVADAAGGATVDAEARTALNTLLARLRVIGLIAT